MRLVYFFTLAAVLVTVASFAEEAVKSDQPALLARRDLKAETESYTLAGVNPTSFKPEEIRSFHAGHVVSFLDTEKDFGVSRLPRMMRYPRQLMTWESDEKSKVRYVLLQRELIGLVTHSTPVTYQVEGSQIPQTQEAEQAAAAKLADAKKKHLKLPVATRKPDEFETSALAKLREGKDLVTLEDSGSLRIVGAIRATSDCRSCHDCKEHDLLGAFTYLLVDEATYNSEMQKRQAKAQQRAQKGVAQQKSQSL